MERILLGYDASEGADAALDWVADRALHRDARVEVVIVTNPLLPDTAQAEQDLARAEQRLSIQVPNLPVESVGVTGRMPKALTDAAVDADVLVIGIEAGRPVREALHGWMSLRVSARSTVPTCIVPAGWSARSGPVTLALATDDSSDPAFAFAAAEAIAADETLRVVHAWSMPITTAGAAAAVVTSRDARAQHAALLDRSVERLRSTAPGLHVEASLRQDNAVSALTHAAQDSSLVVMGTHGRGVMAGGFYGSVGQDLIGVIDIPVIVVPSDR
jgi:nucleotide-binding universal stress UspA family protein